MRNQRMLLAVTALAILCAASLAILLFLPPVFQDTAKHDAESCCVNAWANWWGML
jgi:hypothetical protein